MNFAVENRRTTIVLLEIEANDGDVETNALNTDAQNYDVEDWYLQV